jgi:hypothetical protein
MANHGRPLKMFTDKDEDWPIWEIDFEGWSIRKGFKRFLKRTDPKTIPRVDRSYTATTSDDPNGRAPGSTCATSRATTMRTVLIMHKAGINYLKV